ncbi:heavy metal-binding domain-containing protein [Flavobacterium sp.]|uniref:heavy metal-binding domain-containing protein n=1 Tax=Flavobacterium sp. TaxID=239 RepID=UPI002488C3E8|nr:heavy metal-binding domain-containing protein [Flavobacterium sp.]MDI1315794.1 heavy metal-binding domain-containing protein [Flavobacterium sp.]
MNLEKCPHCNKTLKGLFSAVLIPQSKSEFINKHLEFNFDAYCTSCSGELLNKIARNYQQQKAEIENRLKQIITYIPIISSEAPVKWEYDIVAMVTAQTTSGTGFATELSRSFNDFFGTTSNTTNLKIEKATQLCMSDLRIKCLRLGGNAVISTDIDFNEIGSGSTNMLMVCMAGTAIRVRDITNFNEKSRDYIVEVIELTEKLEAIAEMNKN